MFKNTLLKIWLQVLIFLDIIDILDTIWPKFTILAAILYSYKFERKDVKIIFGIHHFWIQHTQIDLKSHWYRFSLHLHLTSLSRPLFRNGPCLVWGHL